MSEQTSYFIRSKVIQMESDRKQDFYIQSEFLMDHVQLAFCSRLVQHDHSRMLFAMTKQTTEITFHFISLFSL